MREIKVLEFSPHGNLVVAHIGNNIFIKVLNMLDEDQMERSVTIADKPLMPFYFDFDYN